MRRAIAFLTPFGPASTPSPGTLDWFPVVGAVIGLAVGGVWWLAARAWPPAAAAGVVLVADVVLTGYLHLDGLADTADGLLPPMARPRRLEVMSDPAVGAFGAVTLLVVVLLRFGALASTVAVPLVVGALWCGSRTAMAVAARTMHYARPGGLATAFVDPAFVDPVVLDPVVVDPSSGPPVDAGGGRTAAVPGAICVVVAVGLAAGGRGWHGVAALGGEVVAVTAVFVFAQRRVGGFTGDVLGAAGVVGETVGLLVLAAKW